MKQKIAIQGELGSYSHLAANEIYDNAEVIPCKTFDQALRLTKENEEINPSNIQPSKEIKSLGEFKVEINLHSDVQTQITVKVVPQEEIK